MQSEPYITEMRSMKTKRFYKKTQIEVEYLLKATASGDGRMILASAKPTRIVVNEKEIKLN